MYKKTKITLLLAIVLIAISCNKQTPNLNNELDSIISKYVPDKRVAILNVDIIKQGNSLILKGETTLDNAKRDILQFFTKKGYNVQDSISILPNESVGNSKWALISISVAQLRSEADNSAELVSQTIMGTPVKVLKRSQEWSLIQTPDNYISWIKDLSLKFLSDAEMQKWRKSPRVIYLPAYGNIVDKKGQMLSDIVSGCIVQKINSTNERTKILTFQGDTGFIDSKKLMDFNDWKNDTVYTVDDLISDAKNMLGIPYLWGGTSIKAMDCSGFIKTIYFKNGIITARDASQQVLYGDSVSLADNYKHLQRGDLLFFESPSSGRITHVAMHIGNKEYIQAAGRVKINSLDSTKANFSAFRIPTLKYAKRYTDNTLQKGICFVKNHGWY